MLEGQGRSECLERRGGGSWGVLGLLIRQRKKGWLTIVKCEAQDQILSLLSLRSVLRATDTLPVPFLKLLTEKFYSFS